MRDGGAKFAPNITLRWNVRILKNSGMACRPHGVGLPEAGFLSSRKPTSKALLVHYPAHTPVGNAAESSSTSASGESY